MVTAVTVQHTVALAAKVDPVALAAAPLYQLHPQWGPSPLTVAADLNMAILYVGIGLRDHVVL